MLTILVEVIMSAFIANFKASEHPITNIVVRSIIIAVVMFSLMMFSDISNGKESSIGLGLAISIGFGFCISLFLFLIDKLFSYFDKK
ncbi:hypothetical protein ACT4VC_00390 [Acinetobacter baumannii]